ncbi:MAG: 4Fe-4S binding protein [Prevotella sp.]|nr:4Fe-4S binding protein [Prevotella sp.]MCM1075132.1 4Fe-4S binding protein [Ruminococcus sp.]
MKSLKHIRIAISLIMLAECILWVSAALAAPPHAAMARALQISPALAAAGIGASVGAALLWLVATLLFGRIYCSSVCPAGTLQDFAIRLRPLLPGKKYKRFAYKKPNNRRFLMLGIYAVSMVFAIGCVPLLLEPWPAFTNALSQFTGAGMHYSLVPLGVGALLGLICAVASVLLVFVYALLTGRDFCNEVCPIGTVLRLPAAYSLMHIELYPDNCTSCLKCQDVCKASCIDIKTRTIDNARCVRCFNCVNVCDEGAIRFTFDKSGVITGLFQRNSQLSN